MGETGMIDMDAYDKLQVASDGSWRTVAEQPPVGTDKAATAFGFPRMHAYIEQLSVYTDAVLNGTPPPVSGADGRAGVAIALALLESSRTGQVVAVS
jgi:predicted dehydrogenase